MEFCSYLVSWWSRARKYFPRSPLLYVDITSPWFSCLEAELGWPLTSYILSQAEENHEFEGMWVVPLCENSTLQPPNRASAFAAVSDTSDDKLCQKRGHVCHFPQCQNWHWIKNKLANFLFYWLWFAKYFQFPIIAGSWQAWVLLFWSFKIVVFYFQLDLCVLVCLPCAHVNARTHGDQKWMLGPLQLEWRVVMACLMGTKLRSSARVSRMCS